MTTISELHSDTIPFVEGYFYHIYNRGNNKEKIFFNNENYIYFLKKFDKYLSDFLDVYCYCLISNHFHFLIKVKTQSDEIINKTDQKYLQEKLNPNNNQLNQKIIQQFSNFFNCYTKSINKEQHRSGTLFKKHFKRRIILNEQYLSNIIFYIHLNPVHHKISDNFVNHRWSSYNRILQDNLSKLKKNEVINFFGNKSDFIQFHKESSLNFQNIQKYIFD